MSSLDPIVRADLDAALEPGESLDVWAWGPADLPADPGAILGQIMATLLGAFWRALLSPLQRLLAALGVPVRSQVLGRQVWMAVTDRRVLARPFLLQRRILASGPSDEVVLVGSGLPQAWPLAAAPKAVETRVRSTRILGLEGHPGLVLGYAPEAGDPKAERALALRGRLLEGDG
jgi:hypothetical protein